MSEPSQTTPATVDELISAGALEQASSLLAAVPASDEQFAVVRVRLGLLDGTLPAGAAQQALIKLMRRDPDWPGAKALYQIATSQAYGGGQSSVSHSHPPPPRASKRTRGMTSRRAVLVMVLGCGFQAAVGCGGRSEYDSRNAPGPSGQAGAPATRAARSRGRRRVRELQPRRRRRSILAFLDRGCLGCHGTK